jgi:cell division inhibitor SepF
MAGAMRKAMVYLGLVEDEDRYDYDDYDDYDHDAEDRHAGDDRRDGRDSRSVSGAGPRSVAPLREESRSSVATMERRTGSVEGRAAAHHRAFDRITTIHPRTYNEAKQIGESFRDSTPVIMNLSDMDDSDAKRLVDFAAGLVFGLRGTIERVTNKVFLLSPANVTVTAEDKARMAESGFFNQS